MNVAIWIAQLFLGLMFLLAGGMKLSRPKEVLHDEMGAQMAWTEDFTQPVIRFIGAAEVLAALTLLFARIMGLGVLVPYAAVGLALVMGGAAATHIRRKEPQGIAITLALLAVSVFVAVGRFSIDPF